MQLRHSYSNEHHFRKLEQYAILVQELALSDEIYFAPLSDLDSFVAQLRREAPKARAIQVRMSIADVTPLRSSLMS